MTKAQTIILLGLASWTPIAMIYWFAQQALNG